METKTETIIYIWVIVTIVTIKIHITFIQITTINNLTSKNNPKTITDH